MRAVVLALVALLQAAPAFDVVSIKRTPPGQRTASGPRLMPGGRFLMSNDSIRSLVMYAYAPIEGREVIGAPEWTSAERYTVEGRLAADATTDQARLALQAVLAERLHLRVHRERVERDIYALVIARSDGRLGPDIRKTTSDCAAVRAERDAAARRGESTQAALTATGYRCNQSSFFGITSSGSSMDELAAALWTDAGRPVVNRTGLAGDWEFGLVYERQTAGRTIPVGAGVRPPLTTALREQLGLRLQPEQAMLEVLVIDQIERPSEN